MQTYFENLKFYMYILRGNLSVLFQVQTFFLTTAFNVQVLKKSNFVRSTTNSKL